MPLVGNLDIQRRNKWTGIADSEVLKRYFLPKFTKAFYCLPDELTAVEVASFAIRFVREMETEREQRMDQQAQGEGCEEEEGESKSTPFFYSSSHFTSTLIYLDTIRSMATKLRSNPSHDEGKSKNMPTGCKSIFDLCVDALIWGGARLSQKRGMLGSGRAPRSWRVYKLPSVVGAVASGGQKQEGVAHNIRRAIQRELRVFYPSNEHDQVAVFTADGNVWVRESFFGQGNLFNVSIVFINNWWCESRGAAMGVAGAAVSAFLLGLTPIIMMRLIETVGWRGCYNYLGASELVGCVLVTLIWRAGSPETYGVLPDGKVSKGLGKRKNSNLPPPSPPDSVPAPKLTNPTFLTFVLSDLVIALNGTAFYFNLQQVVLDNPNIPNSARTYIYPGMALIGIVSRVASGLMIDKLGHRLPSP
ncbi:hypothetical protein TrRE_jg4392 [Triparma retinervis]|uniref:Uncharacterized protein n=1 Tax=Triparma retinervis TaxID=2557542 RepID=A0A9W7E9A4_9STRA|nr:hypothetical protein TrRE_jg4392 [Triparma retinervis]